MAIESYYAPLSVRSTSQGVDEYGEPATVYGEPRDFMGYIGKPSSAAAYQAAQKGVDVQGRLYAPVAAGIKAFDVVEDADGQAWQVVSRPRDVANRGHHVEADLTMLREVVENAR